MVLVLAPPQCPAVQPSFLKEELTADTRDLKEELDVDNRPETDVIIRETIKQVIKQVLEELEKENSTRSSKKSFSAAHSSVVASPCPVAASKESQVKPIEHDCLRGDMDAAKVQELIDKGKDLMAQIRNGIVKKPSDKIEEAADQLAAITWFLMDAAIKKKQGFKEGTFVIDDSDMLFYNFLRKSPPSILGKRSSSHFVERAAEHFGLDVLNGKMPGQKRHINFALIDSRKPKEKILLYFKPENWSPFASTAWGSDILMHGFEYLASLRRKGTDADDQPGMQKERVPHKTITTFIKIVGQMDSRNIDKNCRFPLECALVEAKRWGVAYMHDFIKTHFSSQPNLSSELSSLLQDFSESISGLDNLEERTGREVCFSKEELCCLLDQSLPTKSSAEHEGKDPEPDGS